MSDMNTIMFWLVFALCTATLIVLILGILVLWNIFQNERYEKKLKQLEIKHKKRIK